MKAAKPDNTEQQANDLVEAKSEILKLRAKLRRTEEVNRPDSRCALLDEEQRQGVRPRDAPDLERQLMLLRHEDAHWRGWGRIGLVRSVSDALSHRIIST